MASRSTASNPRSSHFYMEKLASLLHGEEIQAKFWLGRSPIENGADSFSAWPLTAAKYAGLIEDIKKNR